MKRMYGLVFFIEIVLNVSCMLSLEDLQTELNNLSCALNQLKIAFTPVQSLIQQQTMPESLVIKTLGYGMKDKNQVVTLFKNEVAINKAQNKQIPEKTNTIFRIMSYNVHFWRTPDGALNNKGGIWNIVHELKPDVLILQEVSEQDTLKVQKALQENGYDHVSLCNTLQGRWFGNVIGSRIKPEALKNYHFKNQERQGERRCYSYSALKLPNGKNIHIYGTHLEVGKIKDFNVESLRSKQLEEICSYVQSHLADQNVIIAGDFNETRQKPALQKAFTAGFYDSFTALDWQHPLYTSMYGVEIDFMLLNPGFGLPVSGAYVYYSAESDHLPLVLDIKL